MKHDKLLIERIGRLLAQRRAGNKVTRAVGQRNVNIAATCWSLTHKPHTYTLKRTNTRKN